MESILIDYYKRFQKKEPVVYKEFFTQFEGAAYKEKLPYLHNIEKFCTRVTRALLKGQKVCIYSDYDTDAVTATSVMYWGLISLGFDKKNLSFYVPDRFAEGYGVNPDAIAKLAKENDLIITVDCGINSVEEAEIVKKTACDLIITDHHHLHGQVPDCDAVVNPRLSDYYTDGKNRGFLFVGQDYVESSVTGVGVAWFSLVWFSYFLQELMVGELCDDSLLDIQKGLKSKKYKTANPKVFNQLLSLVAIGTVADCQSILDAQNRFLVKVGLQILNQNNHSIIGLDQLTKQTGLSEKMESGYRITSQDLGFVYSPILNSAGRINHASLSIRTLLAQNEKEAKECARELIQTNEDRKRIVRESLLEVEKETKKQVDKDAKIIWLEGDWSKGIVGLLASRLTNQHDLPSVVISKDGQTASGSLRAPEGYHLPNGLEKVSKYLKKFGGHPGAAGFVTDVSNLKEIQKLLPKELEKQITKIKQIQSNYSPENFEQIVPEELNSLTTYKNILWLNKNDVTQDLFENIWKLDPFGQDFPFPNLVFNVKKFNFRWLGQEQKHAKVFFGDYSVAIFNLDDQQREMFRKITGGLNDSKMVSANLWLQAKVNQNTWNGKTSNELIAEGFWVL